MDFVLIGDRPAGRTATEDSLVQAAALAFEKVGIELQQLGISSTDSNVPMSLGIPAITIAGGGNGGGAHSPDEWFTPTNSHEGPQTSFLIALAMVGIQGVDTGLLQQQNRLVHQLT